MRNFVLGIAVAALGSSALWAEPPIGSRLGERTEKRAMGRESDAAIAAHEIARCMVERKPNEVRAFLAEINADQSSKDVRKLGATLDCFAMGGDENAEATMVQFPRDVMRGMLSEAIILSSKQTYATLPILPAQRSYSRAWFSVSGRHGSVDEMATCVADVSPAGVVALIATAPYSDKERSAIGTIAPTLGSCLVAGAKVDANRQSLRAALADALYQRIANPQETAPSATPKSERGK